MLLLLCIFLGNICSPFKYLFVFKYLSGATKHARQQSSDIPSCSLASTVVERLMWEQFKGRGGPASPSTPPASLSFSASYHMLFSHPAVHLKLLLIYFFQLNSDINIKDNHTHVRAQAVVLISVSASVSIRTGCKRPGNKVEQHFFTSLLLFLQSWHHSPPYSPVHSSIHDSSPNHRWLTCHHFSLPLWTWTPPPGSSPPATLVIVVHLCNGCDAERHHFAAV